jgi:hypothetical protein
MEAMMNRSEMTQQENLGIIMNVLPEGWQGKAKELGALVRRRSIPSAEALFQILMIHFANGLSLRSAVTAADLGGVVKISDVALQYRLGKACSWLHWLTAGVVERWRMLDASMSAGPYRIRYVDGSVVREPGVTGSTWRLHYSISLPDLRCCDFKVTKTKMGETFKRYTVEPDDLLIGDRGYSTARGIEYVLDREGHVLVRLNHGGVSPYDYSNNPLDLLDHLRSLRLGDIGDWDVSLKCGKRFLKGRVCAMKKSLEATRRCQKQAREHGRKGGYPVSDRTLEFAGYTFIFTTTPRTTLSPQDVMNIYRGRWQIECVFKRLKSLIEISSLPKHSEDTSQAWLQGKLLVAAILEALIQMGESFFPWGYPIPQNQRKKQEFMEGRTAYA